MAVLESALGTIRGSIGGLTYRKQLGQNRISTKPVNETLTGVKNMDDEKLQDLANRTGYTFDQLKVIQRKQQKIEEALDSCRHVRDSGGLTDKRYNPSKPGETRFNRCMSIALKD